MSDTRDKFSTAIADYFRRWAEALEMAPRRQARDHDAAHLLAEDAVGGVQWAIVLFRALDNPAVFERVTRQIRQRTLQTNPSQRSEKSTRKQ